MDSTFSDRFAGFYAVEQGPIRYEIEYSEHITEIPYKRRGCWRVYQLDGKGFVCVVEFWSKWNLRVR